jgi:hypothetical protein
MKRAKYIKYFCSRGLDVVAVRERLWILPEGEVWAECDDGEDERASPKPGDIIKFDEGDAYASFNKKELQAMLESLN